MAESRIGSLRLPRQRSLAFTGAPVVMGILNVTPDSFSDGGLHLDPQRAAGAAFRMAEQGAAIIDIGGESTRPGADAVSVEEEIRRVLPVIERIRAATEIPISVDTRNAEVARLALDAGADMINDVSALRHDPRMAPLAAERDTPVILMHMRGEPRTMQQSVHYDDLIEEIRTDLVGWRDRAIREGIGPDRILLDPGIGFGKTFEHNLEILARAGDLTALGPLVIGASRKGFLGHLTGREAGPPRLAGSLAAVAAAAGAGAAVVRVHDVAETVDFLKVWMAIREAEA
ncbi:MAG TPA: dihydropteroate synthase [Thermoanaerobaculia bacterium]|nr:dihydropteroate synthase [Thermoanaerobaculia bacterium]